MSRPSDQDRSLERLLRTSLAEDAGAATPACVDAERLAAWSDAALSPAERASIEAHVASCARCLAILAAFADGAPPVAAPTSFWRWSPARWLVPITTAAAAILIWMVVPERQSAPAFAPTSQVARDDAATVAPATPVPERLEQSADQVREFAPRQLPAAPPPTRPPGASAKSAEPATEAERRRETEIVQTSPRPADDAASNTTEPTAAGQRAARESTEADRSVMAASPPAAARSSATAGTLMRAEAMTVEIHSPDPAYQWRIRGTVVERSTTGGSSWQAAIVPVGAVVTAGVSPSPNICWLVGPGGTVLRTADGSRFESANIPGAGPLVSIQATDANRATVTAADGRLYSTNDSGRTWRR